jgi:Uma2 family endonuclease
MRPDLDLIQGTGFLIRQEPLLYRIPDLAIVNQAEWENDLRTDSDPYSRAIPQLVVEVISPSNRKTGLNRLLQNYADFQIPEVLFIFPEARVFESYHGVSLTQTTNSGVVSPRTMPEVSIDLDRLWGKFHGAS